MTEAEFIDVARSVPAGTPLAAAPLSFDIGHFENWKAGRNLPAPQRREEIARWLTKQVPS